MREAIRQMLDDYHCRNSKETVNALREILQRLVLLGFWRSKLFEHAAFYGGTALRILYGLDRYSEDLDFSLNRSDPSFSLQTYGDALRREIESYGFQVEFSQKQKKRPSPIESAFLKSNTYRLLVEIEAKHVLADLHPGRTLKIRLEVDTDPPEGFRTETKYLLKPIPFAVRVYCLPDLLAGKLHAVLCRRWKNRVKGRDWYDLIWYAGHHPKVRLSHLEMRMRQSGDYKEQDPMTSKVLYGRLHQAVDILDVGKARQEVEPFVKNPRALDVWSAEFFHHIVDRIDVL